MPHFIYCVKHVDGMNRKSQKMKKALMKKMEIYGVQSSLLTVLAMEKEELITKETQKMAYQGKLKNKPFWENYVGSVNDDVDFFWDNLIREEEIKDRERRRGRRK